MAYFELLPSAEQPATTRPMTGEQESDVDAAFAFENEELGTNELRILLANDLFRMQLQSESTATEQADGPLPLS